MKTFMMWLWWVRLLMTMMMSLTTMMAMMITRTIIMTWPMVSDHDGEHDENHEDDKLTNWQWSMNYLVIKVKKVKIAKKNHKCGHVLWPTAVYIYLLLFCLFVVTSEAVVQICALHIVQGYWTRANKVVWNQASNLAVAWIYHIILGTLSSPKVLSIQSKKHSLIPQQKVTLFV